MERNEVPNPYSRGELLTAEALKAQLTPDVFTSIQNEKDKTWILANAVYAEAAAGGKIDGEFIEGECLERLKTMFQSEPMMALRVVNDLVVYVTDQAAAYEEEWHYQTNLGEKATNGKVGEMYSGLLVGLELVLKEYPVGEGEPSPIHRELGRVVNNMRSRFLPLGEEIDRELLLDGPDRVFLEKSVYEKYKQFWSREEVKKLADEQEKVLGDLGISQAS